MDTELADHLDRSIGPAPDDDPRLADLLDQGRRAVRRRRVLTGAASAAAVVVVVGGLALATGDGPERTAPPVADDPTPTAQTSPSASPSRAAESPAAAPEWEGGDDLAIYDVGTGELLINPAATVVQRVDNPFDVTAPATSVGLVLTRGEKTFWYALYWDVGGGSGAASPAEHGRAFRAWLDDMHGIVASDDVTIPDGGDFPGEPADDLVSLADGTEQLVPAEGVTILEQRPGVDVGRSFAAPGDRTAAARVRTATGQVVYVLARFTGGASQAISVPEATGGPDLEAFLAFARERYAAGGGGLL